MQIGWEAIKQESSVKREKKEKTFIVTDENRRIIGVVSALSPEKAAAKIFHQKFREKRETTQKDLIEIRIRYSVIDNESHFWVWVEDYESTKDTDKEMGEERL
jgi:DEAD/DEAH box helicase domain-containing protein